MGLIGVHKSDPGPRIRLLLGYRSPFTTSYHVSVTTHALLKPGLVDVPPVLRRDGLHGGNPEIVKPRPNNSVSSVLQARRVDPP